MKQFSKTLWFCFLILNACEQSDSNGELPKCQEELNSLSTKVQALEKDKLELSKQLAQASAKLEAQKTEEAAAAPKNTQPPPTLPPANGSASTNSPETKKTLASAPETPPEPFTFELFKPNRKLEIGDSNVKISLSTETISWARNRWAFDRYDDRWFEREPEKGNVFVTVDLTFKSDAKQPNLPRMLLLELEDGKLYNHGALELRFFRWQDYGTYLGNYADYRNDFSHSNQIKFTAGVQISKAVSQRPLALVVENRLCVTREEERFASPAVSYEDKCGFVGWISDARVLRDRFLVLATKNLSAKNF